MAKILKEFDFDNPPKPLETYLDGRIWQLQKGVDFEVKPENFKSTLYKIAAKQNKKLRTAIVGDIITVQSYTEFDETKTEEFTG